MKNLLLLIFSFFLLGPGIADAQYTDLINFSGYSGADTGENPYGSLTPSVTGDTLYGMTQGGGQYGYGTLFSYIPGGNIFTNLINFSGGSGSDSGEYPAGSLTFSGGLFYGMTDGWNTGNAGNIFSYNPVGNVYTNLIDLWNVNGANGTYPRGDLTLSGGVFYGLTSDGGIGYGTIFSYNPAGNICTPLISFAGASGGADTGWGPIGSLTPSVTGDTLYGVTQEGGYNNGNIFSYIPGENKFTNLLILPGGSSGATGAHPNGTLTLSGGILYGTTWGGGANGDGVIFSYDPVGNVYTDLINFTGNGGAYPGGGYSYGPLLLSEGILYGVTAAGGVDYGVIFSYNPATGIYKDLHDFDGLNAPQGASPYGSLTLSGGVLYGMAESGGANGDGVIFSYKDTSTATGINKIGVGAINVYSNPTTGPFTVTGLTPGQSVEIYNCTGQRIESRIAGNTTMDFNITAYASGMYLIRVQNQDGSMAVQKKIVKTQ